MVREQVRPTSDGANDVNVPFIDFILCPSYDSAYKKEVLRKYGLTIHDYRSEGVYYPNKMNNETVDPKLFFERVTHTLNEILIGLTIYSRSKEKYMQEKNFGADGKNWTLINVVTKYSPTFGRCYSIQPKDHVVRLGIIGINIITRMESYVYFGYPGQFMYRTKNKVKIGVVYNGLYL